MSKAIVITGAAGNLGYKLRTHFSSRSWNLRLLDRSARPGLDMTIADLSRYCGSWATAFSGADAVIHLAAENWRATPESAWRNNVVATENVLRAAMDQGVKRVIFASSIWVMAGYRSSSERLTTQLKPKPINPYGASKVECERLGANAAANGLSFMAFRIGCCPLQNAAPGSYIFLDQWDRLAWLSDGDFCAAMESAVLCHDVNFAVLNLMSNNEGMRWDLSATTETIGFVPKDGAPAQISPLVRLRERVGRVYRRLVTGPRAANFAERG